MFNLSDFDKELIKDNSSLKELYVKMLAKQMEEVVQKLTLNIDNIKEVTVNERFQKIQRETY